MRRKEVLPYALPIPAAAAYIGIGRTRLRDAIARGVLPAYDPLASIRENAKRHSKYLVRRIDLERFVDESLLVTANVNEVRI